MKNPIATYLQWRKSKSEYQFRIRGANHETVFASERYKSKSIMMKVINRWQDSLKKPIPVQECNSKWKPLV